MAALKEPQMMVFAVNQVREEGSGVGSGGLRVLVEFVTGDLDSR